ncbi:hypothetical protein BDM02DRAFT_3189690 [Thelephora ganbajun]|uniref:Uncharacterized protein n=1 Tax=Thelephora ganbajun TaxID=370292 RepID=A0ACB6Z7L6_THEGA|nr:hypothetical protein BDM02DRAFT_3189690 [Thelephora ganbajun]
MFQVLKSVYTFVTSSIQEFMMPTNKAVEVPSPLPVAPKRDKYTEDYYRDDMVVFEVQDVLFRVPKCLFEPSPGKFRPLLFDEEEDEESDEYEYVIPLPDLTAGEFRALIDFLLPYRCLNRKNPSLQYWINLLSISTKYELDSIRPLAIEGIDRYRPEIDPVKKYALGAKYMIKEWEASSFKILCRRPDPLTVEDAKKLGVVIVTEVFRERERICLTIAPDRKSGPSKTSRSDAASTTSAVTKPTASSTAMTSASPNNTTAKSTSPKVKLGLLEEQNILANLQPAPTKPNNGHSTSVGSLSAPPQPPFSPSAFGKTAQAPSIQQSESNSADVFLGFAEPGDSKKAAPSGPTSTISQGQGCTLFEGVNTPNPQSAVKPTETGKTPRESVLPISASKFTFMFKQ